MLLALLLSFDQVAEPVGKAVGVAKDTLKTYARTALAILVGVWLIQNGVIALTFPWVGVPLVVVGVAVVLWGLWPWIAGPGKAPES